MRRSPTLWPESPFPTHYKILRLCSCFLERVTDPWFKSAKLTCKMSEHLVQLLRPWNLPFRLKCHFNCSGFTCCSHSSMLAIVNHTPFSPKVLDTPTSHNSNLELESAVAPAGPLPCFIHLTSNGVIQKAVIFPHNSLFCKQWPCRIWWFTIPAEHLSCHFLQEKIEFHILGMPG